MTTPQLMGIGEFARASGLTTKALRLYDELDLVPPAEVDPVTGYRRYGAGQLDRARRVARLRGAGMPLERIRRVVDAAPASAAAELVSYWRQVEADVASARAQVSALIADLGAAPLPAPHTEERAMTPTTQIDLGRAEPGTRLGQGAREHQQDAVRVEPGLYAVGDGFGDALGVAEAALAALAALAAPDGGDPSPGTTVEALDRAFRRAAEAVTAATEGHPGSGTTLTALVVDRDQVLLAHLGDSRCYRVRDGRLERLTRDHTVVQTLLDEGRLSDEEARTDDRRVQLNRALAPGAPPHPDLVVQAARPGDRYVLSTDGVHGRVDPATLARLLTSRRTAAETADDVAEAVQAAGADDNYAVVVVDLA